ncbi:hypothetical protein ACFTZG_26665, partial [Streptomyces albidoflavus]
TEATYAASDARPRSGFGGAITGMPSRWSSATTPAQRAEDPGSGPGDGRADGEDAGDEDGPAPGSSSGSED